MSKEITRTTFSKAYELRNALETMINDAFHLGHSGHNIEFAPGVIVLVEDTLTDGSKVARIVIAQVEDM